MFTFSDRLHVCVCIGVHKEHTVASTGVYYVGTLGMSTLAVYSSVVVLKLIMCSIKGCFILCM